MITGAGGTIGSEISMQVANYNPSELIVFEKHEESLYNVEKELKTFYPEIPVHSIIGDITDLHGVTEAIGGTMPQIIFHAAANKHIPMMEHNPSEVIKTNILGTKIVAEAASEFNVEMVVLIPMDKAVNPVDIIGVSRRVAELTVQEMGGSNKTMFLTIRHGNILDVARTLANLYGVNPGKDIEIVFTELRPGEKLFEALFNKNEKVEKTTHPKVLMAVNEKVGKEEGGVILESVKSIEKAIGIGNASDALRVIKDLVPTYNPQPNNGFSTEAQQ